jgi:hypothetical protein
MDPTSEFLSAEREAIIQAAGDALERTASRHYGVVGLEESGRRLSALFDRLVAAIDARRLDMVSAYGEQVAEERFNAGYDIAEVQAAFNVLEEATWTRVLAARDRLDVAHALGLVSTVFGAAKDALARRYVSLATSGHVPTLDLQALFSGTERPS